MMHEQNGNNHREIETETFKVKNTIIELKNLLEGCKGRLEEEGISKH